MFILVDMSAPICALLRMLLEARRSWDRTELLAAVIAGLQIPHAVRIWRMANRGPYDYVSATLAAHRLGVSTRTLRRYTQEGRLPDARSAGGRRILRIADLDAITRKPPAGRAVGYARVSSRRQQAEGDLDRQVARLRAHDALVVFTDVASGLSDRSAGLRKALGECMKRVWSGCWGSIRTGWPGSVSG